MTPNTSATTEPHPLPNFEDTKIAFAHKTTNQLSWALRMFKLLNQNWLVNVGSYLAQWAINLKLPIGWAIKKTIYPLFCGGESLPEIMPSMQLLSQAKVHVLLDYGAEGKDTETDFEKTLQQIVASFTFLRHNIQRRCISCCQGLRIYTFCTARKNCRQHSTN